MLTPEQQAARKGKMTGSRVKDLMTGDVDGIMRLWREMTDQATEEDIKHWEGIRDSLAVQVGEATEAVNLKWGEKYYGCAIVRRGEVVVHPRHPRFACTLDGFTFDTPVPMVIEAKHVGGFESIDTIWARYMPQCQWNISCTMADRCALTVIKGNGGGGWICEEIDRDNSYIAEMHERADQFLRYVDNRIPPIDIPPPWPAPPRVREVDMSTNNLWCDLEWNYCATFGAAKMNASCKEQLKKLIPPDCKRAYGRLLEGNVNKKHAVTFKRLNVEEELA